MLVRYYGHVGVPSGYGDAANETCMAILAAGIDLEIQTDGRELQNRFLPLARRIKAEGDLTPNPDVVIVHTLPLDCREVVRRHRILDDMTGPPPLTVAYTTWEGCTPISDRVVEALLVFDHVWTPSRITTQLVEDGGIGTHDGTRVHTVPHAFDPDNWTPETGWLPSGYAPGGDQPYRFLYVGAWNSRKNVDGLVRAYMRAFAGVRGVDNVDLTIVSAGAHDSICVIAQACTGIDRCIPPVTFINQRLSPFDLQRLYGQCQCFVTASRGEAWNLPAFDAMLTGMHVIAPRGQGSDEFLVGTSADLYTARPAPAWGEVRIVGTPGPEGARLQFYGSQGLTSMDEWHEPDIEALALIMYNAYAERIHTLRVNYDVAERFGRQAVGDHIKKVLEGALKK